MEGGGGNVERKFSIYPGTRTGGTDHQVVVVVDHHQRTRSPSPQEIKPNSSSDVVPTTTSGGGGGRHRTNTETQYADTEVEELFAMLRESESLEEQGDILQYLVDTEGPDFNTGMLEYGKVVTVRDLLKGLYEKACQQKLWGLVRHTAGMLGKRVEDLAKAVTDLLVR